ncbi:MAG: biopolymer transporter ExbD [Candidatus Korobacteraceae bacterium]|jgi:biopolymer transport protein ExbD/biopolymer transport protein TolR
MALAKKRMAGVNSDINVTPMVDVMLVLLIIFMVITPMLQKGVSVTLAKTDNPIKMPEADKEDALIVAIMRDGKIYFNSDVVTADALTDKVKDRLANTSNKRIFVKADAGAKYGDVVAVVDDVRSAGVDQLGLLTEERKQGSLESPASTGTK